MKNKYDIGQYILVASELADFGFNILPWKAQNANGPDITITRGGRAYTVEVKKAKITKRNSLQVPPIEPRRRNDDLVAIVLPNYKVLLQPMSEHLSLCTAKGYRTLSGLFLTKGNK